MKLLEKRRRSKWENTGRWSSVRWWGTTRWWRHRRSVRLWPSSRPWDFERSGRRRSTLWNCPFVSLLWLLLLCCSYFSQFWQDFASKLENKLIIFSSTKLLGDRTIFDMGIILLCNMLLFSENPWQPTSLTDPTFLPWQIHIHWQIHMHFMTDPHLQWELFPCKRCNSSRQGFFSTPSFRNLPR